MSSNSALAALQDAFKSIGSIPAVRKYSALFLNSEQCTTMLYDVDIFDSNCLSLVLSKTMGYYSFLGAGKIITINNILRKKSAVGLNPVSVYTELSSYASNVFYNYVRGNSISTYGDYCAATLHNIVIILLMWSWGVGDKPKKSTNADLSSDGMLSTTHILIALCTAALFCTALAWCPPELYGAILSYSILFNMGSKLPQIWHNFCTKRMGVQSQTAQGMAFFAATMKLFIAYKETADDPLLLFGCYSRVALNGTLLLQGIMYSESATTPTEVQEIAGESSRRNTCSKATEAAAGDDAATSPVKLPARKRRGKASSRE